MSDLSKRISALSPGKRALLAQHLQARPVAAPDVRVIARRGEGQSAPLSFAQQRLWLLQQLRPDDPTYNIPLAVRLSGTLDASALSRTLREIVRRHDVLRTTFTMKDESLAQVVMPESETALPAVDLSELGPEGCEREIERLARDEATRPFDLARGPLLRAALARLRADEHVILLTLHHAAGDAWSMDLLVGEVSELYEALRLGRAPTLPTLPVQYADYASWQREWLQGEVLEAQLGYWQRQLGDEPPALELPTIRPRLSVQSYRGAAHRFTLPEELCEGVQELSRREGVTLFMSLLAAFQTLLCQYTGQEDISVGTPIAGRRQSEIEHLIGCFVNTLVLRTDLSGNPTFREGLRRVRQVCLGAYDHQDLPFDYLVEKLQPERSLSRSPLFQVMFALQREPHVPRLHGLELRPLKIESTTARFDLTLTMQETGGGLDGVFEYNADLFAAAAVARLEGHLRRLLQSVVADPERRLSELPLLTGAEHELILSEWNKTEALPRTQTLLHEMFEAQARQTPDAVAVIHGDEPLTYKELNARANRLARHLRTLGVRPEKLVGICLKHSTEMLVALLGVLKAGGAYVPLDPQYPAERLSFTVADAKLRVLLTQRDLLDALPKCGAEVICVDGDWPEITRHDGSNLALGGEARATAYVIYTSGSTGRPKGVAIEHRSAVALVNWSHQVFSADELAGVLASTSICFDLSVFEIFAPLGKGGAVIVADNALQLPELRAAHRVTLLNTVPSAAAALLKEEGIPASVQTINLAGEPLPGQLVRQLYGLESVRRVLNLYGPTEDTTYSTYAQVERERVTPPHIGRPVGGKQIYILNKYLLPVPVGVRGELYIGGGGLARGYLDRPGLTAEKFIPNPFGVEPGARLYRTGDWARHLPEGQIEFLGRTDHQVKLRGFRIELGEVEAALEEHEGVVAAAAVVRDYGRGDRRLVAYVAAREEGSVSSKELRGFVRKRLPEFMVPSSFILLDALPLTPNGKIDRRALPEPGRAPSGQGAAYTAPRTGMEKMVAEIWAQVLRVERVGIDDNFFDLGGHSLLAAQVVSRLSVVTGQDVPLLAMFEAPTIAELSERVSALDIGPEGGPRPSTLSSI